MATTQYATAAQLVAYVGESVTLPDVPEQNRMLVNASTLLDSALLTWRYRADPITFLPTDQQVIDCFADCVCAQVKWWLLTQDEDGQMERYDTVSFEGVALTRGANSPDRVAPAVRERLRIVPAQYLVSGPVVA